MKKYFMALIVGLLILFLGSIVLLFEIVNYNRDKDYINYDDVKEYSYSLDEKYIISNNGNVDNIKFIFDNNLKNKILIEVYYDKDMISTRTRTIELEDGKWINIYGQKRSINIIDSINNSYNVIKDSIKDRNIYDHSDLYKMKLNIYINEGEVNKIINYTSIITNEK